MKPTFGYANVYNLDTNNFNSFLSMPSFQKEKKTNPICERTIHQLNRSIISACEVIVLRVATLRLKFQDLYDHVL